MKKAKFVLTSDLICFLDLHELTAKEKQDTDYLCDLLDNYFENEGTIVSDAEKIRLAKLYQKLELNIIPKQRTKPIEFLRLLLVKKYEKKDIGFLTEILEPYYPELSQVKRQNIARIFSKYC